MTSFRHLRVAAAVTVVLSAAGCGDSGPTDPDSLRFGQRGGMELVVRAPLSLSLGTLEQRLSWESDGTWTLEETVSYRGIAGDTDGRRLTSSRELSARQYSQWITQVNDNPGLSLFDPSLDPSLDPTCSSTQSRVRLTLTDDTRRSSVSWTRCATGFLSSLTPLGAGPDAAASRVVNAGALSRDFTLGTSFQGTFDGTLPFASLDRGEDTGSPQTGPFVIQTETEWIRHWQAHRQDGSDPPEVDFTTETVIVAAVGERLEAGDSIEVRRVVPVQQGTVIEIVERVPGDFCSPAERRHHPFHIVVTPRLQAPVRFAQPIRVERVPCG